jgi:hypothetical protein
MTVAVWKPGFAYIPGSLCRPLTISAPVSTALVNPGFEDGDTGWTKESGWTITNSGDKYQGAWSATFNATAVDVRLVNTTEAVVTPGQSVTATCMVQQGASGSGEAGAAVGLEWLDDAFAQISFDRGSLVSSGSGGQWRQSTVTALAPGGAAYVRVAIRAYRNGGSDPLWVDTVAWNVVSQPTVAGLIYKAVQADVGTSGAEEPVWPPTLGVTVVDNEVTWEAVLTTRVVWQASPTMLSGPTEPIWPTIPGAFVADNTISWEAFGLNIQDVKCPQSRVVAIAASKVFAADGDIVRFCATNNPLDWSTADDAGYLPTGIQQTNANNAAVMNIYRGNIVVYNAGTFQMWQVDPDPASMALLDQMDGIGSTHQHAAVAVADELFFLSQLGVRTVGIAVGSTNLASADVGAPVDVLVQEAAARLEAQGRRAVGTYYPGAGQFWLALPGEEE